MNTTFTCQVYNKIETKNVDASQCNILKVAATLFHYDFGYICMTPLGLIIVISIFGQIKGNYRWFILNQALWDLLFSSYYSCGHVYSSWVKTAPSCFYLFKTYGTTTWRDFGGIMDSYIRQVIVYNAYSSLLLLSTSRFLALYYPHTLEKITRGPRILITIFFFNFIVILCDIYPIFLAFRDKKMYEILEQCFQDHKYTAINSSFSIFNTNASSLCNAQKDYEKDSLWIIYNILYNVFTFLQCIKSPLFLFPSMVATVMIFWKIAKQAKFQYKHNRKDFISSARIAAVIGIQTFINCFGVFIEIFNRLIDQLKVLFSLKIVTFRQYYIFPGTNSSEYWNLQLPLWLDGPIGLASDPGRTMVVQLRILIEALIVLFIMTGYREAVIDSIKYVYKIIASIWKYLLGFTSKRFNSTRAKISETSIF